MIKKILVLSLFVNALWAMEETVHPLPTKEDFAIAEALYWELYNNVQSCESYNQVTIYSGKPAIAMPPHWLAVQIVERYANNSSKQIALARAHFLSPRGQKPLPGEGCLTLPKKLEIGLAYRFTFQELVEFDKIKISKYEGMYSLLMNDLEIDDLAKFNTVVPMLNKKNRKKIKSAHISAINLADNKIAVLDSETFKEFTEIDSLDLSNNLLTFIDPSVFDQNKKLTFVRLSGNPLTEDNKLELIATFRERQILTDIVHYPWND